MPPRHKPDASSLSARATSIRRAVRRPPVATSMQTGSRRRLPATKRRAAIIPRPIRASPMTSAARSGSRPGYRGAAGRGQSGRARSAPLGTRRGVVGRLRGAPARELRKLLNVSGHKSHDDRPERSAGRALVATAIGVLAGTRAGVQAGRRGRGPAARAPFGARRRSHGDGDPGALPLLRFHLRRAEALEAWKMSRVPGHAAGPNRRFSSRLTLERECWRDEVRPAVLSSADSLRGSQ